MSRLLRLLLFFCAAWLVTRLGSCPSFPTDAASTSHAAVGGTYRLVSPFPAISSWQQVPRPTIMLELTPDHALFHAGTSVLATNYDVTNGYLSVKRETAQLSFRHLGANSQRQINTADNTADDVHAH
jgi:hypothetical protein